MLPYIGEFVGTCLLVLMGNGICANVNLKKSWFKDAGPIFITIGWGFAVMIPAFIFGAASNAHFNPVFTIAFALDGSFPWALVPGYIVAQMLGGFLGAVLVWLLYRNHFNITEDEDTKLACYATRPAIKSMPSNILSEAVATFVLVFAIKGIAQVPGIAGGFDRFLIFACICAMGMSFGGLTGYALNPARDLGPRIAHAILPMKNKGSSHFEYGLIVPIFGPLIGAILAVGLYAIIPW